MSPLNRTLSHWIRKAFCYYVVLSVFFCLQTVFARQLRLFSIAPYFMPCIIVVIAMLDSQSTALGFALAAGLVSDAFSARAGAYYIIVYLLIVAMLTILIKDVFRKSFFSCTALAFGATLFVSLFRYLLFYGIFGLAGPMALITVVLPEAFYSTLFIFIIYPLISFMKKRLL